MASERAICDSIKNESQRQKCIKEIEDDLKDRTYYITC